MVAERAGRFEKKIFNFQGAKWRCSGAQINTSTSRMEGTNEELKQLDGVGWKRGLKTKSPGFFTQAMRSGHYICLNTYLGFLRAASYRHETWQ
ncbi:MAG TPA: hypothetical protein V6D17_15585 [Candidatus Obscuribacterales bacterium]